MKTLIYIFSIFFINSCYVLKSPIGKKEMFGNIKTCVLDSCAILNESIIVIKLASDKKVNINCEYKDKATFDYVEWWPSWLFFSFKDKEFQYLCNPRMAKDKKSCLYDDGDGTFSYNRKKRTLTLSIPKYKWKKTFDVIYLKRDNIVELREIKNF